MKKKVNIFGKSIPVFVLVLLGVGLVSAILVPYLSNTITGQVIVNSPLEMKFNTQSSYGTVATEDFDTIRGGETFTYKTWTRNQGANDVYSYPITTMISTYDWTGDEFTSVKFENEQYHDGSTDGPLPILDMLYVIADNGNLRKFVDKAWVTDGSVADLKKLKLFFDNTAGVSPQKYTHTAGSETWNEITVTTALTIAPDTYTIKLCHIDDLVTGYCA